MEELKIQELLFRLLLKHLLLLFFLVSEDATEKPFTTEEPFTTEDTISEGLFVWFIWFKL